MTASTRSARFPDALDADRIGDQSWRVHASCVGQDALFFDYERRVEAAAICAGCPVRGPCAVYAIESRAVAGVWAGVWIDHKFWRRDRRRRRAVFGDVVAG